jgi:hypothetical protein
VRRMTLACPTARVLTSKGARVMASTMLGWERRTVEHRPATTGRLILGLYVIRKCRGGTEKAPTEDEAQ